MQPKSQNPRESAQVSEAAAFPPSDAETPTTACTPEHSASHLLTDLTATTGPSPAELPELRSRFGPYILLQEIARGGMGVVYRARHQALGREVALKTIQSAHQVKPELVTRFLQEAQAVAQLKHPHIIQVYDFGHIEGRHYFTMALAEGSLLRKLADYQADPRAAIAVMEKVARAVQHVHESGLLHRDLKPGNILLDEGEPLVSDFGLAKSLELELELTRTGSAVGTPAYMAPEQAAGRGDRICPQTDIWALGVILYELLCGKKPFTGNSREEVIRAIQEDEPAAPRKLQPRLDRNLEAILQKCLEKEALQRYASAQALADDLGAWLRGEPIRARPQGSFARFLRGCRKHPLWTSAAMLLPALIATLVVVIPRLDPRREARLAQGQLQRGELVKLIGESGPPKSREWQIPGAIFSEKDGEPFSLHAGTVSLLELLPDPGVATFTFEAEVRHDAGKDGRVGIYVGHQSLDLPQGKYHGYLNLAFGDWSDRKNDDGSLQGDVRFRAFHFHQPEVGAYIHNSSGLLPLLPFVPRSAGAKETWRKLALAVSEEQTTAFFQNAAIGVVANHKKKLSADGLRLRQGAGIDGNLDFPVRGGLGLYVNNCIASFRNVSIIPH